MHAVFICQWKLLLISVKKNTHKRYVSFFSRMSDPCGSRHNTKSLISVPNGSLALLPRRIYMYDPSGSVGKLWGLDLWSEPIRNPDPRDQIPGSVFGIHGHVWLAFASATPCILLCLPSGFRSFRYVFPRRRWLIERTAQDLTSSKNATKNFFAA